MTGKTSSLQEPLPIIPKGAQLKQLKVENSGGNWLFQVYLENGC